MFLLTFRSMVSGIILVMTEFNADHCDHTNLRGYLALVLVFVGLLVRTCFFVLDTILLSVLGIDYKSV